METSSAQSTPLSAGELAWVLLKVLGMTWSVSALLTIPNLIAVREIPNEPPAGYPNAEAIFTTQLLTSVLLLGLGGTLLFATRAVIRLFDFSPGKTSAPLNLFGLEAVGFSLIGVWLLAYALPTLGASAIVVFALSKGGGGLERTTYLTEHWQSLLVTALEAVLGLWLLFRGRRLAAWHRAKPIHAAGQSS